jgi:CheY-like chemotaxis protein
LYGVFSPVPLLASSGSFGYSHTVQSNGDFKILVVDDSNDDLFFIKRALDRVGIGKTVNSVHDGQEAIEYLCGNGKFSDRQKYPFPTIILSDLKMPRMNGFELLRWVRDHPDCGVIPTILLTSSAIEADVREAYRLGANAYMVKPSKPEEMDELLRRLCEFWTHCERPAHLENCSEA